LDEEEEAAEGWAEEVGVGEGAEDVVHHLEVTPIRIIFSLPTVSTATCLCRSLPAV